MNAVKERRICVNAGEVTYHFCIPDPCNIYDAVGVCELLLKEFTQLKVDHESKLENEKLLEEYSEDKKEEEIEVVEAKDE